MADPTTHSWVLVHERDSKNAVRYQDPDPDGPDPSPTKQLYLDRSFVAASSDGRTKVRITIEFVD